MGVFASWCFASWCCASIHPSTNSSSHPHFRTARRGSSQDTKGNLKWKSWHVSKYLPKGGEMQNSTRKRAFLLAKPTVHKLHKVTMHCQMMTFTAKIFRCYTTVLLSDEFRTGIVVDHYIHIITDQSWHRFPAWSQSLSIAALCQKVFKAFLIKI